MSLSESKDLSEQNLSEEEWNELARKVEEEVKEKGVLVFPDHKGDELRSFVIQITKQDDFYSLFPMLAKLVNAGSLPSNEIQWKGILAMAASCSDELAVAWKLAKEVYTEEPRYGLAYGAVAQMVYTWHRPFAALPWLKLAELCQDCLSDSWYKKLRDGLNFEIDRLTRLQKTLEPVFTDDAKFDYLLRLYDVKEDEELFSDFQKVRKNPGEMMKMREASSAFNSWLNAVLRDPIPAIIYYRPDPPAYVPPSDGKVTRLDQLPPSVAARIVVHLEDVQLFSLLSTNKATNALFDRPEVWKALIQRDAMSVKTIRGPFESFEWKHIYRLFNFVLFACKFASPLCSALAPASRDYVLIKQKDAEKLWSMCDRFQIQWYTSLYAVLAVVLDLATELLSLDGSPERRLSFLFGQCLMLNELAVATMLPQPRAIMTKTPASCYLSSFVPSPLRTSFAMDTIQSIILRNVAKSGDYTHLPALNNLYFFKNFDPSFKYHPICSSSRSSTYRRRLPSSLKQNNENDPIKSEDSPKNGNDLNSNFEVSESFAFASSNDVSGVYRLFLRYLNLDLSEEQDIGVASLVFDRKTLKLEGHGRDTLRGPFTIKSGFTTQNCQTRLDYCAKRRYGIETIMPQYLVLTYKSDGTTLFLRGAPFTYGFSGEFEYLPESKDVFEQIESGTFVLPSVKEDDLGIVTGGFTLLYDIEATKSLRSSKTSSSSSSSRKESQFDELMKQNELDEVKKRKERKSNPKFKNMKPYFEPWNYESPHPERLILRNQILHFSAIQMDMWTEAASLLRVLEFFHLMPKVGDVALTRTLDHAQTQRRPQTEFESDIKYSRRATVLHICTAVLLELRATLVSQFPLEMIATSLRIASTPNDPQLEHESAFWVDLLYMIPSEIPYHYELLKRRLSAPVDANTAGPQASRARESLGGAVSKKTSKNSLNPVLLTTLVSVGIAAIGIGAFFVGRALNKRNE